MIGQIFLAQWFPMRHVLPMSFNHGFSSDWHILAQQGDGVGSLHDKGG
jgi:hypothetical protein